MQSILVSGVGGQGSLLASRILGTLLQSEGFDVKVSEVHGMAQRGGAVVTYVKYGEKVYSPVIEEGEADVFVAFELLEGARWASYLKKGGAMLTADSKLPPMPVITGACSYPDDIPQKLRDAGIDLTVVNAQELAEKAGGAKSLNVVMMGALSKRMDIAVEKWHDALRTWVKPEFLDMNIKAFELGRESV